MILYSSTLELSLVANRILDPHSTDPGLLRKHSTFKTYSTSNGTYSSVRTFYHPHPQAAKLPNKPTPLPLLVFVHGLGGSLAQFHPILTSLVNVAPCLGVDLPGCGRSGVSRKSWDAYTTEALTELLCVVIEQYCNVDGDQGVILIGHSMGCSLSASIASSMSPIHDKVTFNILGMIAICPKASIPSSGQVRKFRKLLNIPTPIFDIWRRWDRRGGSESASVARFVGSDANMETKKLQEKFNAQSQTAVWRRIAWGALPHIDPNGDMSGGLPGPDTWACIASPIFLIAGEEDKITKPEEVALIGKSLSKLKSQGLVEVKNIDTHFSKAEAVNVKISDQSGIAAIAHDEKYGLGVSSTETTLHRNDDTSLSSSDCTDGKAIVPKKPQVLKTSILPSPASHALLYDHATYRTVSGLIQDFLADHIDTRLSLGWQLQHLSTEGKWDVKNLEKWQAVRPVSEPIAGVFRAMKTLREIDEAHSPTLFVSKWNEKIKAVIDISHESPVYDPEGLDKGRIQYHKFPTVSKIPPTAEEVKDFVSLVDRLREQAASVGDQRLIGVHCHYGFNRTGFFICSYLIEKEKFGVQQAIDEFQKQRPPGIRHDHFIDTLFVRYCIGLKRAPTM